MTLIPWRTKHRDDASREQQLSTTGGFRNEMDRLFDSFLRETFNGGERAWTTGAWGPPLDVEETDKEVAVRAEIPGMSADDLQLSISGHSLIISGEKKETTEKPQGGYVYQERRYGSFRREVPLPSAVDPDGVQAEYKDGVLHVRLKKSQEALPRRIPVKTT